MCNFVVKRDLTNKPKSYDYTDELSDEDGDEDEDEDGPFEAKRTKT